MTHATNNTYEYHLTNGLKLIIKEDHRAPVAVSQVWYRVGSGNEYGGITGISHALEHMMFKGTPQHPAGEFSRLMAASGADQNASTSNDFTYYYQELATDKLALSFELEADRMQHLILDPQEFTKEIQVVMEERRMRIDDNPQAIAYERFNAAAFVSSPYHHLTIGWMNDLENLTINDLKQWYQTWYAPNNATVVVVGDVNANQVYTLAKKYFAAIPTKLLPNIKPRIEIAPLGTKNVTVEIPAKLPWLIMGYATPSLVTVKDKQEAYALEVLAGILDAGNSSRLSQDIVRDQQIAATANASYDLTSKRDGLFILTGIPTNKHTVEDLLNSFTAQIKKLQTTPVSSTELERVKTQLVAAKIYSLDSLTGQATELGALDSVGLPWQLADQYSSNINKVTAQQIQTVAQKYLTAEHLTITTLKPANR